MDRINPEELRQLVAKQPETKAIEKSSLSESSALMLAGMLQLAAANAKYELTDSEIEFWKRQVAGYPEEMIEKFFSEHIASSKWMPQFCDLHEWAERESEQRDQERRNRDYRENQRIQMERVMTWRSSQEYERDMQEIREKLKAIVAKVKRPSVPLETKREIPLAVSPEKEREILQRYSERMKAQ
jgi:hypothetical protein